MKKEFLEYLKSIGIVSKSMQARIREAHNDCLLLSNEKPQDIFVDEYMDSEGQRQYECINFFSKHYHFAMNDFLGKSDRYFYSILQARILRWTIEKTEYDLKKATDKSRIVIDFLISDAAGGNLKASGKNCEVALLMFKKYLLPNMAGLLTVI